MKNSRNNFTYEALGAYCRELSMLLSGGVSGEEAVAMLAESGERSALQAAQAVQAHFQYSLAEALRSAGGFPLSMVSMVEAGETAGQLEEVLSGLSDYFDRLAAAQRRLKRAVLYPAVSLFVLSLLLLLLALRVLPIFSDVYIRLAGSVSAGPYIGLAVGLCWAAFGVSAVLTAFFIALAVLWKLRPGAAMAVLRRLPVLSESLRETERASFTAAYAIYVHSAVDTLEAFDAAALQVTDAKLLSALKVCRKEIQNGSSFSRAAQAAELYPALYTRMLLSGAHTGRDEESLSYLSEKLWDGAGERLENAVGIVEPVLSVVLTALIAVLLISVMLPLIGIMNTVG